MRLETKCKMCYKSYSFKTEDYGPRYETCCERCRMQYAILTGCGFTKGLPKAEILKKSDFNIAAKDIISDYHNKNREWILNV